jgi:hypothetical protein
MDDPILFWTLFAVIAANIIVLVLAFINAIRVARIAPQPKPNRHLRA